ncbi:hypothetical protein F4780DRAFT_270578 [Xylariomycetidae sp. FL0641]|nr:hypothetical protein F4780DRAFT_270578 [Xylariomycetidae sp. FL0641]
MLGPAGLPTGWGPRLSGAALLLLLSLGFLGAARRQLQSSICRCLGCLGCDWCGSQDLTTACDASARRHLHGMAGYAIAHLPRLAGLIPAPDVTPSIKLTASTLAQMVCLTRLAFPLAGCSLRTQSTIRQVGRQSLPRLGRYQCSCKMTSSGLPAS